MDINLDFINIAIGGTGALLLRRVLATSARVVVFVSAVVSLGKFMTEWPRTFKTLGVLLLIVVAVIIMSGCSSKPKTRISANGMIVDETRITKETYCINDLNDHRAKLLSYLDCAKATQDIRLIPNLDAKECSGFKTSVKESMKRYRSCKINHNSKHVVSNPFNILRTDL